MTIARRQHAVVREFRAAARGDDDRILLDGWHLIREALDAGIAVERVALHARGLASTDAHDVTRTAIDRGLQVVEVTSSVMESLSPVRTPSGVVAIARRREPALDAVVVPPPALVIVAVDVQDPGNAGAIVRAAEAGGASGVCFAGRSADPWSWKALRASMGSTLRLPAVSLKDTDDAIGRLRARRLSIAATVIRDGVPMHDVDLTRPTAVLVGSEGAGLPSAHVAAADLRITIPMAPPVESLNVAVATGVLVYEARRQRRR